MHIENDMRVCVYCLIWQKANNLVDSQVEILLANSAMHMIVINV